MHTVPAGTSHQSLFIRTTCGRRISVGLLALVDGASAEPTATEARKLAAALPFQAAAAEHPAGNHHPHCCCPAPPNYTPRGYLRGGVP